MKKYFKVKRKFQSNEIPIKRKSKPCRISFINICIVSRLNLFLCQSTSAVPCDISHVLLFVFYNFSLNSVNFFRPLAYTDAIRFFFPTRAGNEISFNLEDSRSTWKFSMIFAQLSCFTHEVKYVQIQDFFADTLCGAFSELSFITM